MTLAEQTQGTGRRLLAARSDEFPELLRESLAALFGWPYKVAAAPVYDAEAVTPSFGAVIYTPHDPVRAREDGAIPSDNAAAVIEVVDDLDIAGFEIAYHRIATAKRLLKAPAPEVNGTPVSTTTLGALVAQRTSVPLEAFADALERLNGETPHDQWIDMVVVVGVGVINYGVQFPAEGIAGDHLPPAKGAGKGKAPPWYVVITIRPITDFSFNKFAAFLVAQLTFFSPGAQLPNFQDLIVGMPDTGITKGGFQFNLDGQLAPVPREHYNDRYLAPQALRIEDRKGNLLATIQRLPWQDGSVLFQQGRKVPLEGLMVFFDAASRPTLTIFRRPNDIQLSCVLPMSHEHFIVGLQRFQRQSNMVVKPPAGHWIVQKIADEGASSPFMARTMLGILRLRDVIYADARAREAFDKIFEQVSLSLSGARDAAKEIDELWSKHIGNVAAGTCVRRMGNVIHIEEDIHRDLRRLAEKFLNSSVRALKHGLQQTAVELKADIGFWFQKQAPFERRLSALRATDPALADYIAVARGDWSETLVFRRNEIEHTGWVLPRAKYSDAAGTVVVEEPLVGDQPLRDFTASMLDRLCCAVEDVSAYLLAKRFPLGVGLHEIDLPERPREAPERFRITPRVGGELLWSLSYHASKFEDH